MLTAKKISVSVVIPAYNSANWIKETLDSILAQTYPVLEILVVDDGSTDNIADILRLYHKPLKYVCQSHQGVSSARNNGIRMAKGDFVAFIDADDSWHPEKIESQLELMFEQELTWASCETQPFDSNTRRAVDGLALPMQDGDVLSSLLMNNFIGSATPIVRRGVFSHVGYFNEANEARIGEDWDMWLRIAAFYPLGVVHEKLAFQRLHTNSTMSSTSMKEKMHCLVGVIERAVDREPQRLKPLKRHALANIYYSAGVQLIKENKYRQAREYFLRELQYRPLKAESWIYLFMSMVGPRLSRMLIIIKRFLWERFGVYEEK